MDHGASCTTEPKTGEVPTDGAKVGTVGGSPKERSQHRQALTPGSPLDSNQHKLPQQDRCLQHRLQSLLGGMAHQDPEHRQVHQGQTCRYGRQA